MTINGLNLIDIIIRVRLNEGYNTEDISNSSEYKSHKYLYSNYSVEVYVLNKWLSR